MSQAVAVPRPYADPERDSPDRSYERDIYSWANAQAALLREGRFAELDVANVAEEIESLGRSERSSLRSYLALVLQHMLKWDHQPEKRTRSWATSINVHRHHARRTLKRNPGLKHDLDETLAEAYETAVLLAADESGLLPQDFPRACPYGYDELMIRSVQPSDV